MMSLLQYKDEYWSVGRGFFFSFNGEQNMNKFILLVNVIYLLAIATVMAQEPIKLAIEAFQISDSLAQRLSSRVLTQQLRKMAKTHSHQYKVVPSRAEIQAMLKSGAFLPDKKRLREMQPDRILKPQLAIHQQQLMLSVKLLDLMTFQDTEYQLKVSDCLITQETLCLLWQTLEPELTPEKCSSYRTTRHIGRTQMEYAKQLGVECKDNRRWDCDGRKGNTQCQGRLKGPSQVCFAPKIIKDNVPFESGICSFAVFLKNTDFDIYILEQFVEARITDARRVPTCVNIISKSVSSLSEMRTRVQCKQ